MIQIPYEFRIEQMTHLIKAWDFVTSDELDNVDNSENLHIRIMPRTKTAELAGRNNREYLNFAIEVFDKNSVANPVIVVILTATLYNTQINSDRMVEDKDVWNLIDKCLNIIDETIKEENIVDKRGELIKMPPMRHSPKELNGLI